MLKAEADVGVGGKVKDDVGSCHRLRERRRVEYVAFDERKARLALGLGQKIDLSGGEVVVTDHPTARLKQAIDQIAADKARCTGDEGGTMVDWWSHGKLISSGGK